MKINALLLTLVVITGLGGCSEKAATTSDSAEPAERAASLDVEKPAKPSTPPPENMYDAGLPLSAPSEEAYLAYQRVQELTDRGDFVDAHDAAVEMTELAPDYIGSWILLGNAALSGQEFVKATRRARELKESATPAEQYWADINMSFVTNDTDDGVRTAKKLVSEYPDSARAHLVLSGLLTAQAQHEAARAAAASAFGAAPKMVATHVALGFQYMNNEPKDQAEAQQHFKNAIELMPDEDNFWVYLGDSHRAAGDLEGAAENYGQALKLDDSNAVASVKRGHVNSFLGNYDQAREDYDKGIAAGKGQTRSTLANYRAFVNLHAGNHRAALAELHTVKDNIEKLGIPNDQKIAARIFVLTNIADLAMHKKMGVVASGAINELVTTLNTVGTSSGDDDFARQQKATATYWQGKLQAHLGYYDEALAHAKKFAALIEGDANPRRMERYHELLGLVALLEKDYDRAITQYQQANLSTGAGAGDVKNPYRLASALKAVGRNDDAAEWFKKIADWNFNSVWFAMLRQEVQDEVYEGQG